MKVGELRSLIAQLPNDYDIKVRFDETAEDLPVESVSVNDTQEEAYINAY